MRTHSEAKRYLCSYGGKVFSDNRNLDKRLWTHTGEKYQCMLCDQVFEQNSNLRSHMNYHTGEKNISVQPM